MKKTSAPVLKNICVKCYEYSMKHTYTNTDTHAGLYMLIVVFVS